MKFQKFVFLISVLSFIVNTGITAQLKDNYSNLRLSSKFNLINDSAKNVDLSGQPPKWNEFLTNIPRDYSNFLNITIRSNKIPLYLGTAIVTGMLIATDDWSWRESDKWYRSSNFVKSASDIFVDLGDGKSQFGLGIGFAAWGLISGENKALRTGSQIVQAVLASGFVVQILKHITGRESPFVSSVSGGRWRFFPDQMEYHRYVPHYDAYPSGHLTTSIATVVVIAENYPDHLWIKPVGYLISAGIAIGMVNSGIHWYSDYPLAIILGYTFGMLASHPEGLSDILGNENDDKGVKLSPSFQANGMNLNLKFNF